MVITEPHPVKETTQNNQVHAYIYFVYSETKEARLRGVVTCSVENYPKIARIAHRRGYLSQGAYA